MSKQLQPYHSFGNYIQCCDYAACSSSRSQLHLFFDATFSPRTPHITEVASGSMLIDLLGRIFVFPLCSSSYKELKSSCSFKWTSFVVDQRLDHIPLAPFCPTGKDINAGTKRRNCFLNSLVTFQQLGPDNSYQI